MAATVRATGVDVASVAVDLAESDGPDVIVKISSAAAVDVAAPGLPYGVQKAGIERLKVGLAAQLEGTGVSVVCVRFDELVVTEAVELVLPGSSRDDHVSPDTMAEVLARPVEQAPEVHGKICLWTTSARSER